jgi:RNA polymerase sigma-70 factor, ECF subfamily
VLDESLIEIAALLDLTVDAVKGHLARGRAHLREINALGRPLPEARPASAAVARYVALFNQRDWDGLRALLADDVKLHQSLHPLRVGRADVGLFFTLYAKIDGLSLAPAWLEGREVIAVFEDRADPTPSYIMWLEWRDGRISLDLPWKVESSSEGKRSVSWASRSDGWGRNLKPKPFRWLR